MEIVLWLGEMVEKRMACLCLLCAGLKILLNLWELRECNYYNSIFNL
jgi:hypothetical protein